MGLWKRIVRALGWEPPRRNPATSAGLRAWRERQRRGSVMRPETFAKIERRAARAGYADPRAVAGKAYWTTARAKYRKAQARKRRRARR